VRVFGGVPENIADALHEPREIRIHVERPVPRRDRDPVPLLAQLRADGLDSLRDDARDIDRPAAKLYASLRDARDIEQIIHEPRELSRLALDHADGELRTA